MFITHVSQDTELFQVNRDLLRGWSLSGYLSVTLGKPLHVCYSGLPADRALWVGRVLHGRWTSDTEEEALYVDYSSLQGHRGLRADRALPGK